MRTTSTVRIRGWHIAVMVLLVLLGPVLLRQLVPTEHRHFDGVSLEETRYAEISFHNARQGLQLGGMLFVPPGEGPHPGVVIIHGSGTSRRDNRWYLTLTHFMQQHGVIVLLPDKRGSEKSEGDWRTADFDDLATDTLAAIDYLRRQAPVAVSNIGVIGMSQGGWIAPIVASETRDLDFLVTVVGSAVPPVQQLLYEEGHNLRQLGFLPGIAQVIAIMSGAYIRNVAQADFWDGIADYDPLPYWRDLSVDALVLYGRDDTNVPTARSSERLRTLDNEHIRIRIYDGSGHPLEDPIGQGKSIFRHDALADIRDFISTRTTPSAPR